MHVDNVAGGVKIISPDLLKNHSPCQYLPGIAHKILKQGEFLGANIQCLGEGFYSANIGWVGIFDITGLTNPILKYHNTATIGFPTFQVEGNDFNIYPNPGNGLVQFAMNGANNKDANIKVFDITGNMIFERTLNVNGVSNISYDFSNFSKGIYIVNISSGNDNFNKKLIIN